MPEQSPIRALRLAKGWSLQQLADAAGTSKSQIDKLERGERRLTVDWMVRLAKPLGIDPRDLVPAVLAQERKREAEKQKQKKDSTSVRGTKAQADNISILRKVNPVFANIGSSLPQQMIPVLSAARGGRDQEMFLQDGAIDRTPCPPYLQHVKGAYAIYVVGSSMIPMYRPRQLLYVNPHKPLSPGCGVVIVKKNGAVLIKEFVKQTKTKVIVREYHPRRRQFSIAMSEIEKIHQITGTMEPG